MADREPAARTGRNEPAGARPSHRERVRDATRREIKDIARRHLAEHGPPGVSLRGIAREMGMTAAGLYWYFGSLDDLLEALQADFFTELDAAIVAANESLPAGDVDGRILASLRAFRAWALANPAEFCLLFGPAGPPDTAGGPANEAAKRFAATFFTLFDRLLREGRFAVPHEARLSSGLRRQLESFAAHCGLTDGTTSTGAVRVLASCWVRLYGLVCMEVFAKLSFAMDDMEPLFEAELEAMLTDLGVRYRAPSAPRC